jgi:DNA gyrase subunit A
VDVLKRFIDHRIEVVRRRTDFLLRKAREREHILLGFKKAIENLDAVIKLIRASASRKEAREGLIARSSSPRNRRRRLSNCSSSA